MLIFSNRDSPGLPFKLNDLPPGYESLPTLNFYGANIQRVTIVNYIACDMRITASINA